MNNNQANFDNLKKCSDQTDCGRAHTACHSPQHWIYMMNKVRSSIYNSTSTMIPSPGKLMTCYDKQLKRNTTAPACGDLDEGLYDFNADPFSSQDIFTYRIARSEHILIRIHHHHYDNSPKQNILRLSKGIFLKQQIEPTTPPLIEDSVNLFTMLSDNDDIHSPISMFDFDHLSDMIQNEPTHNKFKPYTYTLGARFTNPYRYRDILIRGNIPLWCQTLIIYNCLQKEPILPNQKRKGLLPFATEIEFEFKTCYAQEPPLPILTLLFERLSMELSEPEFIMEDKLVIKGTSWKDKQEDILNGILYCDIPDALASEITEMAKRWVATKGFSDTFK